MCVCFFFCKTNAFCCFLPSCLVENYTRVAFDVVVAMICGISLVLCGRSIVRGILLQHVGETFKHSLLLKKENKAV